ncbi:leucyl aminopeptidase [Candidatus Phytoplasma luffae]|uniref:Probable cytosol aminopeptidase n=1 Tax=Loofah witches'-broom phytoplasma TaxID=35773 RepID=A0A975IN87_LOWBP|nr:leucyl aminopeptidase [Candidatus Phytoplasma luffae]QTX02586.1 leucyl aminopeptidase [Candidatus Phytoplasma luffae]
MSFKVFFSTEFILSGELAVFLKTKEHELCCFQKVDPKQNISKAMVVEKFDGEKFSKLNILAPYGSEFNRFSVVGLGSPMQEDNDFWVNIGGNVFDMFQDSKEIVIFFKIKDFKVNRQQLKDFVTGTMLKDYIFDRYQTKKTKSVDKKIFIITDIANECEHVFEESKNIVESVNIARDLINQPANFLGTEEFVDQVKKLQDVGVEINILNKEEIEKMGMRALLAVSQGSVRPPYVVVMRWLGANKEEAPLSFVGKGVVFDSGGISIKPSSGMEEMKGDMGGAASVVGIMHLLAARKAKVNVVGIIGLVENMPSSTAQRPGDVVRTMSGQTVEVINTDAEGRMVLADLLWYCENNFKPQAIIDLATLTGACVIALGQSYAGLFSNDDDLAKKLFNAGIKTGEKVWQMPINEEYDKLIDSDIADVKNSGGRSAGSITAAQFLKRFIQKVSWAHLDIAGVAFGTKANSINKSWASGFGVRLLNEFIKNNYEL